MENNYIYVTNDKGEKLKCTILFTHHSEALGKDYVVFEQPNKEYSAASYVADSPTSGELSPIETEEEWEVLENLLIEFKVKEKNAREQKQQK